jgi:hypothetical protein
VILTIEISGPSSVPPGQSAQFSATARLSNGFPKQIVARWSSSNSGVLQVNSAGVATAVSQGGEATVRVEVTDMTQTARGPSTVTRTASREVVVVPDGTYRLVGTVTDADLPTLPVVGARVEVPGGVSAITGSDGRYRLYGVPPESDVEVTKEGYRSDLQRVQLTAHATQNFRLALIGQRLDLAGSYTLTVEASGCPGSRPLPSALQRRTYDVRLTQTGAALEATLTEPRFRLNSIGRGNQFTGRAETDGATFILQQFFDYYYPYYGPASYPNVAERLADGTHLVVSGTAVTTGSRVAGLSGTLNGTMQQWDSRFPAPQFLLTSCTSSTHQFTLTPQ